MASLGGLFFLKGQNTLKIIQHKNFWYQKNEFWYQKHLVIGFKTMV